MFEEQDLGCFLLHFLHRTCRVPCERYKKKHDVLCSFTKRPVLLGSGSSFPKWCGSGSETLEKSFTSFSDLCQKAKDLFADPEDINRNEYLVFFNELYFYRSDEEYGPALPPALSSAASKSILISSDSEEDDWVAKSGTKKKKKKKKEKKHKKEKKKKKHKSKRDD